MRLVISLIVAAIVTAALAVPASGRVLASTYGGPNPVYAFAVRGLVEPRHLRYQVTSGTSDPVSVRVQLECQSKGGRRHRYERKLTAKPPLRRPVAIPGKPVTCVYSVTAQRSKTSGWIAVKLFGSAGGVFGASK
jgi:hypothetical protein